MPRTGLLLLFPLLGFAIKVDTFLKKDSGFLRIFNDNGNYLKDWNPSADNGLPAFTDFEVKNEGNKLILEWKGDKNVKGCLIITSKGKVIKVYRKRIVLKKSEIGNLITIYPMAGKDKLGLPSVVQLDG